MVDKGKSERLSPPLMYAFRAANQARDAKKKLDLRDESGERVIAGRRVPARAVITEPLLKRELSYDLEALVNTVCLDATQDLSGFDHVRRSILNFGFPDIAHRSIDELSVTDIKDEIATVLRNFEPRLAADSIMVTRDSSVDTADLKIRFIVRADLLCQPVNVPVEFVADVELDSGKIRVNRL